MTNRRRARLAHAKKPGARKAPASTVNPNYPLDDKRRSHGAVRVKGADRNGTTGDTGNKGRAPRFEVGGQYASFPKSHKKAGWA